MVRIQPVVPAASPVYRLASVTTYISLDTSGSVVSAARFAIQVDAITDTDEAVQQPDTPLTILEKFHTNAPTAEHDDKRRFSLVGIDIGKLNETSRPSARFYVLYHGSHLFAHYSKLKYFYRLFSQGASVNFCARCNAVNIKRIPFIRQDYVFAVSGQISRHTKLRFLCRGDVACQPTSQPSSFTQGVVPWLLSVSGQPWLRSASRTVRVTIRVTVDQRQLKYKKLR